LSTTVPQEFHDRSTGDKGPPPGIPFGLSTKLPRLITITAVLLNKKIIKAGDIFSGSHFGDNLRRRE
jgi:hypothetical protein